MSEWMILFIGAATLFGALCTSKHFAVRFGVLVVGAVFLVVGLLHILYGQDDLRQVEPASVQAIELLPSSNPYVYPGLVTQKQIIDRRDQIDKVIEMLRRAEKYAPNHPETQWTCLLKLRTDKGERSCVVSATANNGVLVSVNSAGYEGWRLAEYRQDELGPLLEHFAGRR
ncbi:MAG: hypothetical protein AB7K24_11175 [Gemmataceae bacterium]